MSSRSPIIGVCAAYEKIKWSFWDMHAAIVAETYLEQIFDAGGIPFGIAPAEKTVEQAPEIIKSVDALILLGGADIDPTFYGQKESKLLEATTPVRDKSEIALVRAALDTGVPVFGVCRGLQIMNVATGGTLHQDIGNLGNRRHRQNPGYLDESTYHEIEIKSGSVLAEMLSNGKAIVNSHHHQALDKVGHAGKIVAISPQDNIIEAVEWLNGDAIGVQWHPETMIAQGLIPKFVNRVKEKISNN